MRKEAKHHMMGTSYARPCAATGCSRTTRSIYGRYCERCHQRAWRHGHPEQTPVRKPEVEKYRKRIKRLLRRGNLEKIEQHLRAVAARIEDAARSPEAVAAPMSWRTGQPWGPNRWKQKAVDEILRVLGETDAVESGITVAAVFLLRDREHRRFADDRAFDFELVRLWRSQTRLAFGSFWNQKTDKVTAYYKPLRPRVVEEIEPYLTTAYARFAGYVIGAFQKHLARQAAVRTSLDEGFAELQA